MNRKFIIHIFIILLSNSISAQVNNINDRLNSLDYSNPKEFEIGGITVSGVKYLDHSVLIHLSGLKVGDVILVPGEEITQSVEKLWKQGLFSDVRITATKIIGNRIFFDIYLLERPRLSKFSFTGVTKSEAEDIREDIKLLKGSQVTDNVIINTRNKIKQFYIDKGFLKTIVNIQQLEDTSLTNNVELRINVLKNEKVKINEIIFSGNTVLKEAKLRRTMKETKRKIWYNIFKSSKLIDKKYKEDKEKIIAKYNELGYRDAQILSDSIYFVEDKIINIEIRINEGSKYYFRDITWVGNSKYTTEVLDAILGIKKGDIFDQSVLDNKLYIEEDAVSSLYLDNGYLFFSVTPVETKIENDSIDLEMRIIEGKQARINRITISGNTKTNEHVVRRELHTKPGQLFSRSDIIRSHRELAQLGYFDPERLDVTPIPNPVDGTVDLEYTVEEKPSDQIELSGGWGANMVVGTLGLVFNNFSARNFFKADAWRPLPSGDGQKLSLRAQTNGTYYQSYSASFIEPWLGGRKPNSFSVSIYHSIRNYGTYYTTDETASMKVSGVSIGLGRRLQWPDDFFVLSHELSYQQYNLKNYTGFLISDGKSKNISLKTTFTRNSVSQPIYPRRGSMFSLSLQLTPPFSLFTENNYSTMTDAEKYKWIEYHKWTVKSSWFTTLAGKLVLNTKAEFGFLGIYNEDLGPSPFEGFNLGGDGLSGYNLYGRETIALRGYDNGSSNQGSLTPVISGRGVVGGNIYNKFVFELRYPFSLNPSATIYGLAFLEGGNAWYEHNEFNPFDIKRSAGVGIRVFLPMFGMLGVDWGYGFDPVPNALERSGGQFAFTIGQQF